MSDNQHKSSRGRVIKKTGMSEAQMKDLDRIRQLKEGKMNALDQYEVSYHFRFSKFIEFDA